MSTRVRSYSKGAELAHPSTKEKDTQLIDYIKKNFPTVNASWWLGASDLAEEGTWKWTHDNSKFTFNYWHEGEPSNNKDNENCLSYWTPYYNWKWNDLNCWWLGASDLAEEGIWRWTHDNSKVNYAHLDNPQAKNHTDNLNCLMYYTKVLCYFTRKYPVL
ncbi:Fc fragment of IgE, low affinity II, receptor for (CD23) [Chamberlinius hualienensis]